MPKSPENEELRHALLVIRCQLGERAAFEELIRDWSGTLLRHVRRIAGPEPAEDLAQEVWLRALRGIANLRENARIGAWLFGIAHHVVMDHFRLRYARDEAEVPDDLSAEGPDSGEEIMNRLEAELAALPVLERETLTLFYLEELSLKQIAGIQSVPEGTVKSRLSRARGLLRRAMSSHGEHHDA
ncbi:MAG TPA: RNA polymerase sigma factor [Rhizomicrobium sp.]|nr:RNA polymerase sigma factor [Rhizomicrobium sp.]